MKKYRLLAFISFLLVCILLAGCVKGPFVAKKSVVVSDVKTVEKPAPPSEAKPPEAKPAAVEPSVIIPPSPTVDPKAVGCVFPLSGRFANESSKALDAAFLSAKIFDQRSPSPWKIVVADSGETPEGMRAAVAYLAEKANVMAIIAVSGGAEASDAANEAQKRKVPLILITSKEGVTDAGEYVFQHFLTPTQQTEALTRYALDTLNVAIFSILYPQDAYGEEMLRLFQSETQKVGGKVIRSIPYSKTQTDFTEQIQKLTANKTGKPEKVYATTEEAKNKVDLDFEALYIPDSAFRIKMITSQLAFYNVKGMKLLGTSLWHSADLLKKGSEYLDGAYFADSFFANGFLPETNDFVDRYYSAYSREPGNLEALTYDTVELVLSILENQKMTSRAEFIKSLLAVTGFRGATGSISFRDSRVAHKNAFILKVDNGKLVQVK